MSLIPFSTPALFYKVIRSVSMSFQSLNACGVPMASRLDAAVKDGGRGRWCCVLSLPSVRPSLNSRNSPIESLASQKNEKFFVTFVWISSVKYVRSPCFFFFVPVSAIALPTRQFFVGLGSHKVLPAASHCCHCFFQLWLYDFFCNARWRATAKIRDDVFFFFFLCSCFIMSSTFDH